MAMSPFAELTSLRRAIGLVSARRRRNHQCLFISKYVAPCTLATVDRGRSLGQRCCSTFTFLTPGKAHVRGPSQPPLVSKTIPAIFQETVTAYGKQPALVVCDQGIRWSYDELSERVDSAAAGLLRLGLHKGDRVGVWMPNNAEWVVMQLATAKIGCILVNINPAYRLPELKYALNLVGCKALVLSPNFAGTDYVDMMNKLCPELATATPGKLHAEAVPSLRILLLAGGQGATGMLQFDEVYGASGIEEVAAAEAALDPRDPINIQFTSGTTGNPKATTLTHHGLVNNGRFIGSTMEYSENDRVCIPVPLYHCFGMVLGNLNCIAHGAAMVYPAGRFDALTTMKTIEVEKCTAIYGVPTMFIAMFNHPDFSSFKYSTLRTGIMAGSICPIDTMRRVVDDMNVKGITICYGMTETSPVSFQTHIDDPLDKRCATVGRVHPHVECKVVDEDGQTCEIGKPGELLTSGYLVMDGYWGQPQATADAIRTDSEGKSWMYTGDLAVIDERGYCSIVGRLKDVIIRGGENIFPAEVEDALLQHPKIVNCSVIGLPDGVMGEQVCAWVQWADGLPTNPQEATAEIREYLKDQVAHFKVPKHILFKEQFPMTITGKIQKYIMRDLTIKELS